MGAAFEEPVEDRLGEVSIMQYLPESRQGFVGGHDARAVLQVPLADDAEEHVGGVCGVALIAEFIDDEHVRMHVGLDDHIAALAEPTSDAFGGALVELLRDEPLRRRLASAARQRVSREFTPAARNRKLHAFYDALEAKLADGAVDAKA